MTNDEGFSSQFFLSYSSLLVRLAGPGVDETGYLHSVAMVPVGARTTCRTMVTMDCTLATREEEVEKDKVTKSTYNSLASS